MICKCRMFLYNKEGELVCSVCGKPANFQPAVEDKIERQVETKDVIKPVKRRR